MIHTGIKKAIYFYCYKELNERGELMKFLIVIKNIGKCVVDTNTNTILYPDGIRKVLPQWDMAELKQRRKHQDFWGLI